MSMSGWCSDVCSSDLARFGQCEQFLVHRRKPDGDRKLRAKRMDLIEIELQHRLGLPPEREPKRVGSDIGVAVAVAADPVSKRKKALWPVFEELVPRRIEARHGRQEAFPHEGNGVFHLVGDEEPVGPERPRLPEQRDLAADRSEEPTSELQSLMRN